MKKAKYARLRNTIHIRENTRTELREKISLGLIKNLMLVISGESYFYGFTGRDIHYHRNEAPAIHTPEWDIWYVDGIFFASTR